MYITRVSPTRPVFDVIYGDLLQWAKSPNTDEMLMIFPQPVIEQNIIYLDIK